MVRAPLLKWCGNILLLPSKCRRLKGGRADIFLCAIGRNRARQNPASEIEARRVDWVRFFVALRMTANCDDRGKVKRQGQLAQLKLAATDANTFWRTILHLEDF